MSYKLFWLTYRFRNSIQVLKNSKNFEELDYENSNINNNNKEYMKNTFYKNDNSNNLVNTKKSYKLNYEQRVYIKWCFDQFYANLK